MQKNFKDMKKIIFFAIVLACICSSCDEFLPRDLSPEEIVEGLKEALRIGAQEASNSAMAENGFYSNPVKDIRIPLPKAAEDVINELNGLNPFVLALAQELFPDLSNFLNKEALLKTINQAAEYAAKDAFPIFLGAIKENLTFSNGWDILTSDNNRAATDFLYLTTELPLKTTFTPVIADAINTVQLGSLKLGELWTDLAAVFNEPYIVNLHKRPPVDPNLEDYITDRAIFGLMELIAIQEEKIRTDPLARVNDILQRVFKVND